MMKKFRGFIQVLILLLCAPLANAQMLNWGSLKEENRHIVSAGFGAEYGIVYGLGYSYHIHNKLFPIIINAEYSFPSGSNLFDDYKTKIGGRIRWVEYNHFQFSTNIHGVVRGFGNNFVRLVNFGSDLSGVAGYYRSGWFVAAEVGFDKAISTHFKHKEGYEAQFPDVKNGWYEPATGGNFYYGLQTGCSFGKYDIMIKAGKIVSEDFKTTPFLPFYGQLGCNVKF